MCITGGLHQGTIITMFGSEMLLKVGHHAATHTFGEHSSLGCLIDTVNGALQFSMWYITTASKSRSPHPRRAFDSGSLPNELASFDASAMPALINDLGSASREAVQIMQG